MVSAAEFMVALSTLLAYGLAALAMILIGVLILFGSIKIMFGKRDQ